MHADQNTKHRSLNAMSDTDLIHKFTNATTTHPFQLTHPYCHGLSLSSHGHDAKPTHFIGEANSTAKIVELSLQY